MNLEELKESAKSIFSKDFCDEQKEKAVERAEKARNAAILNISRAPLPLLQNAEEKEKFIILIDIVGFSKSSSREQLYKIYVFQRYIMTQVLSNRFSFSGKILIDLFVPTGDGCYIIADKCREEVALSFLENLMCGIKFLSDGEKEPFAIRTSALMGKCIPFVDLARHRNYVGEGMNEASRILSGGQTALEEAYKKENPSFKEGEEKVFSRNTLYLGQSLFEAAEKIQASFEEKRLFTSVKDKHGKERDILVLRSAK